jgi:hypothetical protein
MVGLLRTGSIKSYRFREYTDRLAVWKANGLRLTWEEVQEAKTLIWGDRVAIEVYPAASDVVNKRHTHHLWSTPEIVDVVRRHCRHPEFSKPQLQGEKK